jgi:hypothetical protein
MIVGPSARSTAWEAFFAALRRSAQPLTRLIDGEDDMGSAFFEIETYINGLYLAKEQAAEMRRHSVALNDPQVKDMAANVRWLEATSAPFRVALGPRQNELSLGLLRWMRRACLSAVLGAGVTMDTGVHHGPSWSNTCFWSCSTGAISGRDDLVRLGTAARSTFHRTTAMFTFSVRRPNPFDCRPVSRSWREQFLPAFRPERWDQRPDARSTTMPGLPRPVSLHRRHCISLR